MSPSPLKDMDFARLQIIVRGGKGDKDRVTMLPVAVAERLREHLAEVKRLHGEELKAGRGEVWLPEALARKFPKASREWIWQWAFPAKQLSKDPESGKVRRHHVHENAVQKRQLTNADWPSAPPVTRCVIPSRRIFWRMVMISARARPPWSQGRNDNPDLYSRNVSTRHWRP